MDVEEAWSKFKKIDATPESVKKSEVSAVGKLDTIAAQLNEIAVNTKRTAEVIPKILGDDNAINSVNEQSAEQTMGGTPPMGAEQGGAPPMGAPQTEGMPMGNDQSQVQESAAPVGEEDEMSDEELNKLLGIGGEQTPPEGSAAPEGAGTEGGVEQPPAEEPVAQEGSTEPPTEAPTDVGGGEVAGETKVNPVDDVIGYINTKIHEAVDNNDNETVLALTKLKESATSSASAEVAVEEPLAKSEGEPTVSDNQVEKSDEAPAQMDVPESEPVKESGKEDNLAVNGEHIEQESKPPQTAGCCKSASAEEIVPETQVKKSAPTIPSMEEMMSARSLDKGKGLVGDASTIFKSFRSYDAEQVRISDETEHIGKSETVMKARDAEIDEERTRAARVGRVKGDRKLAIDPSRDTQLKKITARSRRARDANTEVDNPNLMKEFESVGWPSESDYGPNKGRGFPPEELGKRKKIASESTEEEPSDKTPVATAEENGSSDEEMLAGLLMKFCNENGIPVEKLNDMSDEEILSLLEKIVGSAENGGQIGKSESSNGIAIADPVTQHGGSSGDKDPNGIAMADVPGGPTISDEGSVKQISGVMPAEKSTDPNSIASAKPVSIGSVHSETHIGKSATKMMSMSDMIAFNRNHRAGSYSTVNGDLSRTDGGDVRKSVSSEKATVNDGSVFFGDTIAGDWEEYKQFKGRN